MLSIYLIAVALTVGGSEAIVCYECDSVSTPGCGATLTNPAAIPTCTGTYCGIGRSTNTNPTVYVRLCGQTALPSGTDVCNSGSVGGVDSYDCACNTASYCLADFSGGSRPPPGGAASPNPPSGAASANVPSGALLATSAAVMVLVKLQG
jgi:hypothetical protein